MLYHETYNLSWTQTRRFHRLQLLIRTTDNMLICIRLLPLRIVVDLIDNMSIEEIATLLTHTQI